MSQSYFKWMRAPSKLLTNSKKSLILKSQSYFKWMRAPSEELGLGNLLGNFVAVLLQMDASS